jgi:hypothetical protein
MQIRRLELEHLQDARAVNLIRRPSHLTMFITQSSKSGLYQPLTKTHPADRMSAGAMRPMTVVGMRM